jgi:putative phosphoribosyl transferase
VVVLGLPRGGVPVAAEVAAALGAPLDVLLVRKLGLPDYPELAMGAVAEVGGDVELVRNEEVISHHQVSAAALDAVYRRELLALQNRGGLYRESRQPVAVTGNTVIVVDDGLATGSTIRAAVAALRRQRPAHVVIAVPVGSRQACALLRREADDVVCASTPEPFRAVGLAYRDFTATTDDEVRRLLLSSAAPH